VRKAEEASSCRAALTNAWQHAWENSGAQKEGDAPQTSSSFFREGNQRYATSEEVLLSTGEGRHQRPTAHFLHGTSMPERSNTSSDE
jgi:hypothetical protein